MRWASQLRKTGKVGGQKRALLDGQETWFRERISSETHVSLRRLQSDLAELGIVANPDIIFFDEPTTGLDPIMADVINNLIVDCLKRLGATTISITRDIAMIYKRKIIWQGPAKMVDRSGSAYVDQFIYGRADGPIQMDVLKG